MTLSQWDNSGRAHHSYYKATLHSMHAIMMMTSTALAVPHSDACLAHETDAAEPLSLSVAWTTWNAGVGNAAKCRSWCTWRNDTDFCELHCAALDCIALHCTLKVTPLVLLAEELLAEEGGRKGGTHAAPCLCMYAGSSDAQLRAEQASARLSAYLQMYAELLSVKLHTAGARWYSHSAMHYAS